MGYGALDAVDTPALGYGNPGEAAASLLAKIAMIGKLIGDKNRIPIHAERGSGASPAYRQSLVAIGASAGGPAALAKVLSGLPKNFPASIVVVQHVDEQFASGMAEWLSQQSVLPVRVAEQGDRPTVGTVLLAGTGDHLVLKTANRLAYTSEPSDYVYRPSVDIFFQSVNLLWPGEVVGVLLTGMGRDGALGLKALRNKGRYTIAQHRATSARYGMPNAAGDRATGGRMRVHGTAGGRSGDHRGGPPPRAGQRAGYWFPFLLQSCGGLRGRPGNQADGHFTGPGHARRRRADLSSPVPS